MVHIYESTVGRRFAGWFIRNTEHAQRVLHGVRNSPLPMQQKPPAAAAATAATAGVESEAKPPAQTGKKVAWGKASV